MTNFSFSKLKQHTFSHFPNTCGIYFYVFGYLSCSSMFPADPFKTAFKPIQHTKTLNQLLVL